MKRLIALLVLICTVWAQPTAAQPGRAQPSERRVALVIGNNDYVATTKLERAVTDARAMGAELRQVGFQVIEHSNLDRRGMNQAINELVDKVSGGGVGVLFFAGHGVQVSGTNYLLPTDIKVSRAEDLVDEAIDLGRVMDRLAVAKARFALMIIDACRDNPFPRTPGRSIGAPRGLSIPSAPDGLMVVYSAGVNEQALDKLDASDRDPNGLFTREFLKQIRQPGVRVDEMVRRVRTSVREQAQRVGHAQNPAIYDQAQGEFYFVSPVVAQTVVVAPLAVPASPVPPAAATASKSEEVAYELAFWDAIKSTSSASDYEEYLRQFPAGRFAGLARARRDRLLAAVVPVAEVKPAQQAASSAGVAASPATPTDTAVRPTAPVATAPATPVVQSAASAIAMPSAPRPTGQQPALNVQGATTAAAQVPPAVGQAGPLVMVAPPAALASKPTAVPEQNAPTSLAAIRGKRYFGRSQSYEIEVEVVAEGLNVVRFGSVDGRVQFRCGLFRNEIAVGRDLAISDHLCGSSGGGSTESNNNWPRKLTGSFPSLNVAQGGGPVINTVSEDVLLIDQSLRGRFDGMLKANPGLTTGSFANEQYGQVSTSDGQAVSVTPVPPIVQGAVAAAQVASAAPSAAIVSTSTSAPDLLKPPVSLTSIRGKRFFGRSQSYEIEVEAVAGGLSVLRFETVDRRQQFQCGFIRNELAISDALVIATQACGAGNSGRTVSGAFPKVLVQPSTGWANPGSNEILFLDASLRARFDDMVKATPGLTTQEFAEMR